MRAATEDRIAPARFFWCAEKSVAKSDAAGRPVYEDKPFIEVWTPGDATNIVRRPAYESDKSAYPREWAAFNTNQEQRVNGTPLEELGFLTEAQRLEFKAVRVQTAEQLAAMPDDLAQRFQGMHAVRRRVQAYLDAAAGNAPLLKMQSELEQRDVALAALQAQLKEQGEALAELRKPAPPAPAVQAKK